MPCMLPGIGVTICNRTVNSTVAGTVVSGGSSTR